MKKLTFLAPCYNGESYVARFLDSVLEQTHPAIELVIVNDGSKDKTEEILTEYEKKFAERGYDYIHLSQDNTGMGGALNNGLKYVTGDYLTWFGSDDFAAPTYAEELVNFLEENKDFAVVRCEGYNVDKDDVSIIKSKFAANNNDKHNPHLFMNAIEEKGFHFGYSVVRMSVFDEVNPKREIYPSRQGQNWQLLLPVFYAHKSAFYEKPLYYVIDDANSVSKQPHKQYESLKKQNEEYERILVNTLNSMDIPDRDKYLKIVEIKYIRRRLLAAMDFKVYDDVITEYKKLEKLGVVDKTDRRRYIQAKIPVIDKVAGLIRRFK